MDSSDVHAISLRNKRNCRTSLSTSKRRNISFIIAIWIGSGGQILWNAVAICEMSKTSWQTGKNSVWKTLWRTTQRANNSFWSNGWISSNFTERFFKNSSIWQQSITRHLSWLWANRGGFGKEIYWLQISKSWKSWTHQKFFAEDWMQKKSW